MPEPQRTWGRAAATTSASCVGWRYSDEEDWTCSKDEGAPNQQEIV